MTPIEQEQFSCHVYGCGIRYLFKTVKMKYRVRKVKDGYAIAFFSRFELLHFYIMQLNGDEFLILHKYNYKRKRTGKDRDITRAYFSKRIVSKQYNTIISYIKEMLTKQAACKLKPQ